MIENIKVNSFFSGIGGFDLGFEKIGFNITFQCEINDFCIRILNKHWPNAVLAKDITTLSPKSIPNADIWCGGFPCQDVSVARGAMGRDGLKGKNSGLFYDFFRLVKERKPEVILLENVTGLLNSHKGEDFKIVLESFTSIGYGVSWRVFNSRYFGTPQSRPRVYICAWKNNLEKAVTVLHEYEASVKPASSRLGFLAAKRDYESGIVVPEIAYCLAATSGRHTGTDWSRTYVSYFKKVRRLTPSESEKLQGFPADWTIPNDVTESEDILDLDTLRYHAIGNAVSVPVIVWIADRIKKMINEKTTNKGVNNVINKFHDFSNNKARTQHFTEIDSAELFPPESKNKIAWKSGGMAYGDKVVDSKVHHQPTYPFESSLIDLIEKGDVSNKYFISSSAAQGILRRVNNQNRVLFAPLQKALERLANTRNNTEIFNDEILPN